ncbi:ankyrin repeat ph and sec7 domain containing protein secg-related [Anaeramoeba flamelloides]|uniref:Ankyrin repeat ph and sec7 domain containing protein secg-related n=1 Tax=Anaeramoeba flamelloides TaxID=1746091 RepID=A0AAV7YNQ1_9EUKA|nr:ankyrin repeat ph and sec7 domain containing protein secg-related [Anaeramoeba flamelloides]
MTNYLTEKEQKVIQNGKKDEFIKVITKENMNKKSKQGEFTPLIWLCWKKRDLELIRHLLELGANPNLTTSSGWTPLHYLCEFPNKDTTILQLLLENGANPNIPNSMDWTPLHCACSSQSRNPDFETIKLMISKVANVSVKTKSGWTALHLICEAHVPNYEIAKMLIKNGADVNSKNEQGQTVVHLLSEPRDNSTNAGKILKIVLEKGANPNVLNTNGFSPLHLVCFSQKKKIDYQILKILTDFNVEIDIRKGSKVSGSTALHFVCNNQKFDWQACKILIKAGADLNLRGRNGNTALFGLLTSIQNTDDQLIEFLIENGADFEVKNV